MKYEVEIKKLEEDLAELKRKVTRDTTTNTIVLKPLPNRLKIHVADRKMTWHEATAYAASRGMRLPNKIELQAIAASTGIFGNLGLVWSLSALSSGTGNAWNVDLNNGGTYYGAKTMGRSVLCVHAP